MKYNPLLQPATLLRRYKRFLADIVLSDGRQVTIHCPNTGSMKNCAIEGSRCWYSISDNPKRKYPYTWELATTPGGHLAGINTGLANKLVKEAIENDVILELVDYAVLNAEVKYGEENSRIDFLLSAPTSASQVKSKCYVEVKSVTLHTGDGQGLFPDAISQRGTKHLRELMAMVEQGNRAVLLFCVQHSGIERVSPADLVDPVYGKALRQAIQQGVEVIAYRAHFSLQRASHNITLVDSIPVML